LLSNLESEKYWSKCHNKSGWYNNSVELRMKMNQY
jgi:hypothetical protein